MIPAIIAALSSIIGTVANVNSVRKNNQLQMELADKTNAASVAQAERAYQRSQASNQVGLMQQAGMSKAGAINAINGGGSYQPAPMQTASTQAPQVDLSHAFDGLIQVGENAKQRKAAEKLQREQIDASKEAQKLQIESEEKKHAASLQTQKDIAQLQADTTNRNADNRLQFDKEQFDKLSPYQIRQIEATIGKISAETQLTKTQEKDLAYRMAEYQSKEYKSVRDAQKLLEGLQADFDYKITNKSFNDYLNENYDYKDGEYIPKKWHSNANKVQQGARTVWNTIFELIPVNLLLEALGGTVENVKAIKTLSKIK